MSQSTTLRNRRAFRMLTHVCRVIVALTFIFSGAAKAIDPWGMALNVNNYLVTYGLEWFEPLVMVFSIWLCGAELMMGCMLLFKVRIRMCSTFASISMVFFTILTFLSATFIPVEDCGCFGEVIKLSPMQTFLKNLVLLPMILTVWWRYRPDRMFAFSRLEFGLACLFFIFSMGVGTYSYYHLPPVDLLPYREGTNIAQAMEEARNRQTESEVVLIYRNRRTGKLREFSLDDD
ncbi:MAG: DoxX protein, partial [Alistipes sp.]|nr:DoxX protein [Alistipes sp.]